MSLRRDFIKIPLALAAAGGLSLAGLPTVAGPIELLNVSYDPTRELYGEFNKAFARHWKQATGQDIAMRQSHGGSGRQARSIIDGLQADVATLALGGDTDALATHGGWVAADWQKRLPHNASPYHSTIVLVVRRGNPKNIRGWDDLARPGVGVITPNPKTSGGARWGYLALWEHGRRQFGGEAGARQFVARVLANVPVLDTGARAASTSFAHRGQGDVLIAWENEAWLLQRESGGRFEIVAPSLSIRAEPAVAVVDRVVDRKGTRAIAEAYLRHLYSEEGQDIIGRHHYRPTASRRAQAKYAQQFPRMDLFTIEQAFGGWAAADRAHFAEGGSFDQVFARK